MKHKTNKAQTQGSNAKSADNKKNSTTNEFARSVVRGVVRNSVKPVTGAK